MTPGFFARLTARLKGAFSPLPESRKTSIPIGDPQPPKTAVRQFGRVEQVSRRSKKGFEEMPDVFVEKGEEKSQNQSREVVFPRGIDARELSRQIEMQSRRYSPGLEEEE